jgi:uncharacterized membrane protein
VSTGLATVGLLLSAYLTVEHLTAPGSLACPATAAVNCARVTTSEQSTLFGVPVALLGVGFFVAMMLLCLPWTWRLPDPRVEWGRIGLAVTGVAFVLYLVYAELFLLDTICLWCTAVHILTLALLGTVAMATALLRRGE